MPNFALHVLLASRVADDWRAEPASAPFDLEDAAAWNGFLHGCIGPDMGMYPGGDRLFSDVVHHMRTARMARALLDAARPGPERAFAWGWLTHVVADAELHPLVNQAAAESLGWARPRMDDPMQHMAHARVELGMEVEALARWPFLMDVRLRPVLDRASVGFLAAAFHDTYGIRYDENAILRSHAAVLRLHRYLLLLGRYLCYRWGHDGARTPAVVALRPVMGALRWMAAATVPPASAVAAFLDPLPVSPHVAAGIDAFLPVFPRLLRGYQASGLATLEDIDLETGLPERPARPTASTLRTLASLALRGLSIEGHPAAREVQAA